MSSRNGVKVTDYLNRKIVEDTAAEALENGNTSVTTVEVAAKLFPRLVLYVGQVLEQDRKLRISDSQDDIPHLGLHFVED